MNPALVCRHLRTKKMYIPAQADEVFCTSEDHAECGHCWCNKTLTEVGPDDRQVGLHICCLGRPCFEN